MSNRKSSEDVLLRRGLALILAVSVLLLCFSGLAQASTSALDQANGQVQALKDLLAQLDDQMSAATENYDYANQQLADTQAAVTKTSKELTQGESDLAAAQAQFDQRVVEIYKSGDVTVLAVLMNASSFSDLVTQFEQLSRISRQDAQLVKRVQDYTTQVADNKAKLDSELKQQTTYAAQTAAAKQKVLDQITKQNQALKGKEAQVAEIRKEEAAQQAVLAAAAQKAAEEAAAQAAAQAAAAAKAKTATTTTTSGARTPTTTARGGKSTTTTSGRRSTTGHLGTQDHHDHLGWVDASLRCKQRRGGGQDRPEVPGGALPLGRQQPQRLRLFGLRHVRLCPGGSLSAALERDGLWLRHSSGAEPAEAWRLSLFLQPDPPRGHRCGEREHDRLPHRRGAGREPVLEQLHGSPPHPPLEGC